MEPADPHAALTPKLVGALTAETMRLADQVRAYFDHQGEQDRAALAPALRVGFCSEALKVTTRLMHVMAWLLTRKAAQAGEMGAAAYGRLEEITASDPELVAALPPEASRLITASEELYGRIARLQQGGADGEASPSPARGLLGRLQRSL